MKNTKILFFTLLSMIVFLACEKTLEEPIQEDQVNEELNEKNWLNPAFPLSAIFLQARLRTSGAENPDPDKCSPGLLFADQRGQGRAEKLGRFTTQITFCGDPSNLQIGPNGFPIGGTIPYSDVDGVIKFRNGDEAYFIGSGTVVLDLDNPRYDAYFKDRFEFTHVKINGEIRSASGYLYTNSRVHNIFTPNEYTTHRWSGVILIDNP